MKSMFSSGCLAALGLVASLQPATAQAGVIGEYAQGSCGFLGSGVENLSIPVAAAGHTWLQVNTLDASSLSGLNGLYIRSCGAFPGNAAVNSAVFAGMALMVDVYAYDAPGLLVDAALMPGAPAISFTLASGGCNVNYSLAAGSPIASGPGGTLTDDSLDVGGPGGVGGQGFDPCTFTGGTPVATLPAGTVPFFTTTDALNATAVGYGHGAGQVVVSASQNPSSYLYNPGNYAYPGAKTFYINAMAWALAGSGPMQTCASEGYTYTKLSWCKNICENGLTGATRDMWIRRWIDRYRVLPYCLI